MLPICRVNLLSNDGSSGAHTRAQKERERERERENISPNFHVQNWSML